MEKPPPRGLGIKWPRPSASSGCTGWEQPRDSGAALGTSIAPWGPEPRPHPRSEKSRCPPASSKAMHVGAASSPHRSKPVSSAAQGKPTTLRRPGPHARAGSPRPHRISRVAQTCCPEGVGRGATAWDPGKTRFSGQTRPLHVSPRGSRTAPGPRSSRSAGLPAVFLI